MDLIAVCKCYVRSIRLHSMLCILLEHDFCGVYSHDTCAIDKVYLRKLFVHLHGCFSRLNSEIASS